MEAVLSATPVTREERAFQTILQSRVNRGGILDPDARMLKHGEHGKGLTLRWYPQTLKRRLLDIVARKDRITFIHGDGIEVMRQHTRRDDVVWFIDPPYTVAVNAPVVACIPTQISIARSCSAWRAPLPEIS